MKRLLVCILFSVGCTVPTQPLAQQPDYRIQFVKKVDTIFVDAVGGQVTKHLGAVTNIRDRRMVLINGNIFVKASAGFGHVDTVPTVNAISHTYNGYVGTAFGAFPSMIGLTAIIVAKVVADSETAQEFANPQLRRVLAIDTMRVVILPRR